MTTFHLTLNGPVLDQSVAQLMQIIGQTIAQQKIDHLYIAINTPGGSVNAGITLYHFLRSLPIKVTTHNIGQVDSIGNVVFLSGEDRFASPATSFLLHGVSWNVEGPAQFSAAHLMEFSSQLKRDEERIMTITADRTKLNRAKMKKFFKEGSSLSAEDARREGIVTEVKEYSMPAGEPNGIFNSFPSPNQTPNNESNAHP